MFTENLGDTLQIARLTAANETEYVIIICTCWLSYIFVVFSTVNLKPRSFHVAVTRFRFIAITIALYNTRCVQCWRVRPRRRYLKHSHLNTLTSTIQYNTKQTNPTRACNCTPFTPPPHTHTRNEIIKVQPNRFVSSCSVSSSARRDVYSHE